MMSEKGGKANFLPDDLLNESQFLKDSPSNKKIPKRLKNEMTEEEGIPVIGQYQTNSKKKKLEVNDEVCEESRQKTESGKERSDNLLKNLSELMVLLEADRRANKKKLKHLNGAVVKCILHATAAHIQKQETINDIYASFIKQ